MPWRGVAWRVKLMDSGDGGSLHRTRFDFHKSSDLGWDGHGSARLLSTSDVLAVQIAKRPGGN